jgi:phage-related protein
LGTAPVKDYIDKLPEDHKQSIRTAKAAVLLAGLRAARHLRGDLYEVRAYAVGRHYRLIFSLEGRRALIQFDIFDKDDNKTSEAIIKRAQARLADWRSRGNV